MEPNEKKWLSELKAGDSVFVCNRYKRILRTVEKITPTGRIKVGGEYYRTSGYEMGGGHFGRFHLEQATFDAVIDHKKNLFIGDVIKGIDLQKISYEQAIELNRLFGLKIDEVE